MSRYYSLLFVFFLISCERPIKVTRVKVAKGAVEETVSSITSGTIKAEKVTDLAFGTVGRVSTLNVCLGDMVEDKQVLAELENKDWRTALDVAEKEYARQTELIKSNVSAKQVLDQAREKRDIAAMALEKSIIRAPFSGIITEMNLEVGQLSQITAVIPKPLIRLVDLEPRYVQAEIDEVDLGRVKEGMSARIKVFASRREPFQGRLRKIVPAINTVREQDRTATVELDVDSKELLPDGASADVEIVVKRVENILVVPSRAVIGRKGSFFVFVDQDNKAKKREIQIGIRGYDLTEVSSGVKESELVLIPSDISEIEDGKSIIE